jgi:hypothetical protein
MTSDANPAPGSMTVPPLFGWEGIVVLLVAAVVIGVGYLLLSALAASRRPSADWDEWLQGRSRRRDEIADGSGRPGPPHAATSPSGTAAGSSGALRSR